MPQNATCSSGRENPSTARSFTPLIVTPCGPTPHLQKHGQELRATQQRSQREVMQLHASPVAPPGVPAVERRGAALASKLIRKVAARGNWRPPRAKINMSKLDDDVTKPTRPRCDSEGEMRVGDSAGSHNRRHC